MAGVICLIPAAASYVGMLGAPSDSSLSIRTVEWLRDSGFVVGGHAYAPLKPGLATILRYRDGRVDIAAWTGGPDVPPDVIYARQKPP